MQVGLDLRDLRALLVGHAERVEAHREEHRDSAVVVVPVVIPQAFGDRVVFARAGRGRGRGAHLGGRRGSRRRAAPARGHREKCCESEPQRDVPQSSHGVHRSSSMRTDQGWRLRATRLVDGGGTLVGNERSTSLRIDPPALASPSSPRRNACPLRRMSPLLRRNACPLRRMSPLLRRNACPLRRMSPLLRRNACPLRRMSPLLRGTACPLRRMSPLLRRNGLPALEDISSASEERSPAPEETLPRTKEPRRRLGRSPTRGCSSPASASSPCPGGMPPRTRGACRCASLP